MSQNPGQITNNPAELYRLNVENGITNIGSNPENDIVITGKGILPFHLMLDHRQKPYRIIPLSPAAEIWINGVQLAGMEPRDVSDLNQVMFAGFSLRAQEGSNGTPVENVAIIPVAPAPVIPVSQATKAGQSVLTAAVTAGLPVIPAVNLPSSAYSSRTDEIILVQLTEASQTINVNQTAVYQMLVINGGPIVASFDISVQGLPAEWVEIVQPKLNLYEGGRTTAVVRVTPPRESASRAGEYRFQIQITSPNYPGNLGFAEALLTIHPYYDFSVGNINPRSKSVSWGKKSATTHFPIHNYGNSPAKFNVQAQDEENGLHFEFPLTPGVALVRQAEVQIPPGEAMDVPVLISPIKRNLVRVRSRQYQYSVTTTSQDDPTALRTVAASFTSRPLIGLFGILLTLIILAAVAYLTLQPRIDTFTLAKDVIRMGESAVLKWNVSIFTTDLRIDGLPDPITGAQGQVTPKPTNTATTYTLVAGNWLSRMLRMDDLRSKPVTVLAIPPYPEIVTFFVDKNLIFQGDEITIKWSVKNADEALLTVEGVTQTLKGDALNGELKVKLKGDSLVSLQARNNSGTVTRSDFVQARPIRIAINNFSVTPKEIIKGDPVTIAWEVSGEGVENVMISPFKDPLPLSGSLKFFPTESTEFVLTVKAREKQEIRLLSVGVQDKIVPQPPKVDIFKAAPNALAVGGGSVEFSWSVSGQTTKIEITSKDGVLATNLPAQGFRSYSVSKTTDFFITAYNGTLTNSKDTTVTVAEPKKQVEVYIKSIEPNGDIRKGATVLVYVDILAQNGTVIGPPSLFNWPEISKNIVVTDGYDTCPIELPKRSCSLPLNHAEVPKYIWATYQGDDNYGVHESDHTLFPFNVVGAPSHFSVKQFTSNGAAVTTIVSGQLFNLNVELTPDDPTATAAITGKVVVTQGGKAFCTIDLVGAGVPATPYNAKGNCPTHPPLPLSGDTAGKKITLDLAYQGNGTYAVMKDTVTIQVDKAPSVVSITSNLAASTVIGQALDVAFSVEFDPSSLGSGTPTGNVIVRDVANPSDSCTASLLGGSRSCSLVFHKLGLRSLEAIYEGDGNFNNSTTPTPSIYKHQVNPSPTTTTVTRVTALTSAEIGQTAKIEFQVQASGGGTGTPTGKVNVFQDGVKVCDENLSSGVGYCLAVLNKVNSVNFTAQYQGDGSLYLASLVSAPVQFTVNPAQTKTIIKNVFNPDPALPSKVTVQFEVVTLLSGSGLAPYGTVDVVANNNNAVSCLGLTYTASSTGSCDLDLPLQGDNSIKVTFNGSTDQLFAASAPANSDIEIFVVKQTTTVTLTTTQSNTVVDTPVTFTITINTSGTQGAVIGIITVSADTGEACANTTVNWPTNTYTCSLTFTAGGVHRVTAAYVPDSTANYLGSSKFVDYTVQKAGTSISGVTFNPASPVVGQVVTINFSVTTTDTATQPTGTVTVTASASETCTTSTLTAGSGSCDLTFLDGGPRSLTIAYVNGTRYKDVSLPVSQSVAAIGTETALVFQNSGGTTINTAVVGQTVTLKATVTVPSSSTFNPTSGSINIPACSPSTISLSGSNSASCTTSYTATGTFSTTATYTPSTADANKLVGSTSPSASITISPSPTTTTISFNPATNVGVFGQTVNATITVAGTSGGIPNGGTVNITTSYTGPQSPGPTTTPSCPTAPVSAGTATCALNFPAAGNWKVNAVYSGNANYQGSTMTPEATYTLAKAATTLSLIPGSTPTLADTTVSYSVALSVNAPGSGTPAGNYTLTATPGTTGTPGPSVQTVTWATSTGNSKSLTFNGAAAWSVVASFTDTTGNFQNFTTTAITFTTSRNTSTITFNPNPPVSISANSLELTYVVTGSTPNLTTPASGTSNDVTLYAYSGATLIDSCHASLATGKCTLNQLNTSGTTYRIYGVYNGNYLFNTDQTVDYLVLRN